MKEHKLYLECGHTKNVAKNSSGLAICWYCNTRQKVVKKEKLKYH